MSTEHQRYSLEHQAVWIASYATEHGYEIVKTYSDAGKSGLRIEGRDALLELLGDVVGRQAGFTVILVLDVSRWGRFQDPDQAAHYEFICKAAGVRVEYCAEAFENDGSVMSALLKQFKRAMAAEFSRELSVKIAKVQRGLAAKGYRQGGPAGYGLRRQVVNEAGEPCGLLAKGEQKAVYSHRVILVPGPAEEVETVRRIYRLFVIAGMSMEAIVRLLNAEGSLAEFGSPWTRHRVHRVLSDEKYVGTHVFGRHCRPLRATTGFRNPPETWVRVEGAFEALVGQEMFAAAKRAIANRSVRMTDEDMLDALRRLRAERGYLSTVMIEDAEGVPCVATYQVRFGGLMAAYKLIGYRRGGQVRDSYSHLSDQAMLDRLADLLRVKGRLSNRIVNASPTLPCAESYKRRFGTMVAAYAAIGYAPPGSGTSRKPRGRKFSDEVLIARLGELLAVAGRLSWKLISTSDITPAPCTYMKRFGGLAAAYARVGYGVSDELVD